ncbi:SSMM1 protein, partial [Anseranas semipalmata]|nr:SSMM1 protein [Anseranas semipalmata]
MANPFSYLLWYYWQNDPLLSGTRQKPDERKYDEDEEGFGGIGGKILLWCCTGILIVCLVCWAYTRILQKAQDKRPCSDKRETNSKVPRSPTCTYYSRFNAWLFLSNIFSGTKKKCIQQPYGSTCHSGTAAAGCSCDQRQEKQLSKLSQETACHHYSFNAENDNPDFWAPVWKANEMQAVPRKVSHRQCQAQEQRDTQSYWIRKQLCRHCKAEWTQQWLFQHFFKPVSPPPEKNSSLEK